MLAEPHSKATRQLPVALMPRALLCTYIEVAIDVGGFLEQLQPMSVRQSNTHFEKRTDQQQKSETMIKGQFFFESFLRSSHFHRCEGSV